MTAVQVETSEPQHVTHELITGRHAARSLFAWCCAVLPAAAAIDYATSAVATALQLDANPLGLVIFLIPLLLIVGLSAVVGLAGGIVLGAVVQPVWSLMSRRRPRTRLALACTVVLIGNALFWTFAVLPADAVNLRWPGAVVAAVTLVTVLVRRTTPARRSP